MPRARANTAKAKNDLRAAFIKAGRKLLTDRGSKDVSLRRIAAAAGYSPGTIYQYFDGHRALLLAIREEDMLSAVMAFERIAASETDPEKRVIKVFVGVARYWLDNFDPSFVGLSGTPAQIAAAEKAIGLPAATEVKAKPADGVGAYAVNHFSATANPSSTSARMTAATYASKTSPKTLL